MHPGEAVRGCHSFEAYRQRIKTMCPPAPPQSKEQDMRLLWWWFRPPMPDPPEPPAGGDSELLQEINRVRLTYGLLALVNDVCLSEQAQQHSARMKASNNLTHTGFRARLNVCEKAAGSENVAAGYRTARQCVDGWMNSPGHRRNMLGQQWTVCGVGEIDRWYTAIFSR